MVIPYELMESSCYQRPTRWRRINAIKTKKLIHWLYYNRSKVSTIGGALLPGEKCSV
jgi:hypothetical protein